MPADLQTPAPLLDLTDIRLTDLLALDADTTLAAVTGRLFDPDEDDRPVSAFQSAL